MIGFDTQPYPSTSDFLFINPPSAPAKRNITAAGGRTLPFRQVAPPAERKSHIASRFPIQVRLQIPAVSGLKRQNEYAKEKEVAIASLEIPKEERFPSFAWPISEPELTSLFGPRWGKYHYGLDIISREGDMEIKAAKTGRVVKSERTSGGYGNLIILDHGDGVFTYYAHLSKRYVKEGELIRAGEVLGIMGDTGHTTGIHLHFEIRKDQQPVDPSNLLP